MGFYLLEWGRHEDIPSIHKRSRTFYGWTHRSWLPWRLPSFWWPASPTQVWASCSVRTKEHRVQEAKSNRIHRWWIRGCRHQARWRPTQRVHGICPTQTRQGTRGSGSRVKEWVSSSSLNYYYTCENQALYYCITHINITIQHTNNEETK